MGRYQEVERKRGEAAVQVSYVREVGAGRNKVPLEMTNRSLSFTAVKSLTVFPQTMKSNPATPTQNEVWANPADFCPKFHSIAQVGLEFKTFLLRSLR